MRRGGTPVKMREQSFLLLVYLLERAGEIVTREQLCRVLWPSDTFVDFEHSLNTAVMKLRNALGDSADAPLYIETIPKQGYRFIAPVSQAADAGNGNANIGGDSGSPASGGTGGTQQAASTPAEATVRHRPLKWNAAVLGLIVLAVLGSLILLWTRYYPASSGKGNQASIAFQIVPLTTAPGDAKAPAISPDGREIAYIWDGPDQNRYDLYVQLVGSDTPLRLTQNRSGFIGAPTWSPDGHEIAFSRCDGKDDGVFLVPALGGTERKLTNVGCLQTQPGKLAWLSDGKGILMVDRCGQTGLFGVVLFSLATGEKQCLARSGFLNDSDRGYQFSLSPDGKTIAFTPATRWQRCEIYTVPLAGGTPHPLTAEGHCSGDLMWTPDSQSIVFESHRTTLPSLWRVSANGGPIQPEATYPAIGSFSKDGRRFVYSDGTSSEPAAIWRADLTSAGGTVLENRKLIHTQYPETDAQPSPDGARVVWMSVRTGFQEIWISDATGGRPLQLTHLEGFSGTPRWSPDGKWIAFDSITRNGTHIFVVDSEGRNLHSITDGPNDNVVPSWSRDGKAVYFASNRTGSWQVWKHTLQGGAVLQLTRNGGFDPYESYDGQTIYFSKQDQAGIWSIPASGGTESLVIADKPQVGFWGHWAITQTGIYLLNVEAEPRPRIEFYPFAQRRTSPVLALEKHPMWLQPSLSSTANGKTIYYTQYDWQSVIKMREIAH